MTFGRPLLRTSYEQDAAILPTWFQKGAMAAFLVFIVLMVLGNSWAAAVPDFFLGGRWLDPITKLLPLAIAAIGANILIGVAGQVSLGHGFFMGVGAYAAVVVGGTGDSAKACIPFADNLGIIDKAEQCGLGLPLWLWLPAAGAAAALVGIIVSPAAMRVRGLYLAIVTVGLVFIGQHLSRMLPEYAGDAESGRKWPTLDIRLWKEEKPLIALDDDGAWFGFLHLEKEQKQFFFMFVLTIFFVLAAKNLARSRTGRALQAIRDRDVAAEVMGVPEFKYKRLAFAISSFYAGIGGALFASFLGRVAPNEWSLFLSVDFIAILLIGGAGTIAGTLLGTVFVELLPNLVESFTEFLADRVGTGGIWGPIADVLLTSGAKGDFGPISLSTTAPGWPMSVYQWNFVIYGVLIIVFLIAEPLGLFGIWLRFRNYWKGWPFSY